VAEGSPEEKEVLSEVLAEAERDLANVNPKPSTFPLNSSPQTLNPKP